MAEQPGLIVRHDIPAEVHRQAGRLRDGWVYEIAGHFGPDDAVPPTAIKGAWRVDEQGRVTGEFMPNPRFMAPPDE